MARYFETTLLNLSTLVKRQIYFSGSISFIGQPLGSMLSGLLSEPLGRKKSMFIVNVPHILAWLMLYYGSSKEMIFIAFGFLGLGAGLMEAPIITYLGEIWYEFITSQNNKNIKKQICFCAFYSEPSVRGILTAFAGISATTGIFLVFLLGSLVAWREVALFCAFIPAITMIAICFVSL